MFRALVDSLRNKLRAWLGVKDQQTVTVVEAAKSKGISIAREMLVRAGERHDIYRRVQAPALMPGVVPTTLPDPGDLGPYVALDSAAVAPAYAYAQQQNCGLGFPGYAYLAELSQRSEYRAPAETMSSEMTREFCKLIVKASVKQDDPNDEDERSEVRNAHADDAVGKPAKPDDEPNESTELPADDPKKKAQDDKLAKLTEAMEDFKVCDVFRKCAELDDLFGRAQLFIDIDTKGRDPYEVRQLPLLIEPETIPKGSLKGFTVVEPLWTTPYNYNATDPLAPDFYKPRSWFVMGFRVHASRLLTFVSREVPDMLKPAYNFGGLSMTQLMEPYVFRFLRTRNAVSDLIHNFSVMCLKTDMSAILAGEADKIGGLMDRAKLFTLSRDNQGLMLLNKDTEELDAENVPLAGLHELQQQSCEQMAAPSHIPLVKLLGTSPQGLNASSEGEIVVFYDFVGARQQSLFSPHMKTVLQVLQLHLFGDIDDSIGFEWVPLTAPTVKELAEIRKADAETDGALIDKGVISPEESRKRVAADPNSGYNNLSGPPPEPPTLPESDSAELSHGLNEEAAQAAHKRQLEQDKANKPAKAA
jgi:phage-related protein (TIGR01555 family)